MEKIKIYLVTLDDRTYTSRVDFVKWKCRELNNGGEMHMESKEVKEMVGKALKDTVTEFRGEVGDGRMMKFPGFRK